MIMCSSASGLLWSSGGAGVANSGLASLEPTKEGLEEPDELEVRLVVLLSACTGCKV